MIPHYCFSFSIYIVFSNSLMSRPDILEAGERLESLSEKLARTGVIVDGPWEWLENTGYVFGPISHKKSSSYLWGRFLSQDSGRDPTERRDRGKHSAFLDGGSRRL